MAKRKRVRKRTRALPSREELKTFVRTEGLRYLAVKNINSVGIGWKISAKGPSGALCVQFTVDRKATAEHLESLGYRLIPPQFVIGGKVVPSDVIERRFCPSWLPVTEVALQKEDRKTRQNIVFPFRAMRRSATSTWRKISSSRNFHRAGARRLNCSCCGVVSTSRVPARSDSKRILQNRCLPRQRR